MNTKTALIVTALAAISLAVAWFCVVGGGPAADAPDPHDATLSTGAIDDESSAADASPDNLDPTTTPPPPRETVEVVQPPKSRTYLTSSTRKFLGRIVDDRYGNGIAGARFSLSNTELRFALPALEAIADSAGNFELEVPSSDRGDIAYRFAEVSDSNGEHASFELAISFDHRIRLRDGDLDLGTLRLMRGVAIDVRVLDAKGDPVASEVEFRLSSSASRGGDIPLFNNRSVRSSPRSSAGTYRLLDRVAPPDARWRGDVMLAALTEQGLGVTHIGLAPDQELLDPLTIQLWPNGAIDLTVVDAEDRPIENAEVHAEPRAERIGLEEPYRRTKAGRPVAEDSCYARWFRARTDAAGKAAFRALPSPGSKPGARSTTYTLHIHANGYSSKLAHAIVSVDEVRSVRVTLTKSNEFVLYGAVREVDGTPIPRITIVGGGQSVTSDEAGEYRFASYDWSKYPYYKVEPQNGYGRVAEAVPIQGARHDPQHGEVASFKHDIVLEKCVPVVGRVVDQSGSPVAGARVLLGIEGGTHYEASPEMTGADGRFAFPESTSHDDSFWVTPPPPESDWEHQSNYPLTRRDDQVLVLRRIETERVAIAVRILDAITGTPATPVTATIRPLRDAATPDEAWRRPTLNRRTPTPIRAASSVSAQVETDLRYRLRVTSTDGRCGERTIVVPSAAGERKPADSYELRVGKPGAVVCTIDASAVPDLRSVMVLLEPPTENAYAVDASGEPEKMTENTGLVRLGVRDSFRLERLTPNVPLRLRALGDGSTGTVEFSVSPGGEARVTLQLR